MECVGTEIDDDSACQGMVADDCSFFLDVICSDQVAQLIPVCETSCETAGEADHDKCDSGYFCIEDGGDFTCQPPQGAGDCCMDQAACPGVGCAEGLGCGDEQTPAVSVCCVTGNMCCTEDADCQGLLAGYTCDQVLFQCKTDCSSNTECQSGYFCKEGACVEDFVVGDECVPDSDVCQAGLHCGGIAGTDVSICCEEGKTCCRLGQHTECGLCEQCGVDNYCDYQLGVDYKDNCDAFDCTNLVIGWDGDTCTGYATTVETASGRCNGAGACYTLSESCIGSTALASCASVACKKETKCVAGNAVSDNNTVAKVCYESGTDGFGGDTCYAGGLSGFDNGTPCGTNAEWYRWYNDTSHDTLTWFYFISSYVDWSSPTHTIAFTTNVNNDCTAIPDNGSLRCDYAWVEMLDGQSCPEGAPNKEDAAGMATVPYVAGYNGPLMDHTCNKACPWMPQCMISRLNGYDCYRDNFFTFRDEEHCMQEMIRLRTKWDAASSTQYCLWARWWN